MGILWDRDVPTSVRDVVNSLEGQRELAYTTLMTVLDNLHRKEMVSRELHGRAYYYSPARSRAEYSAVLIADAMDDLPDRTEALLQFMGELTPRELTRIRDALNESASETGRGRKSRGRGRS